ncbi:peptidoglycan-binding domain-containing protein [Thalassovita aquimarina]|uniref:Peptidoglycan-binding protein n=1 Tax=Thalassovita aquimarina TaxID=2785917 RepID=A0ABS5HWD4_9RHOB|nr:peptidoglycan-binding protein [Thalassovita aquimarina]
MRNTIAALLCAGTLAGLTAPAIAENPTVDIAQPGTPAREEIAVKEAAQAASEASRQQEKLLKMALGGCFQQPPDVAPGTKVTIGFELDERGELVGIPEPLGDATANADVRRLYLRAATALDTCAPFPLTGESASFKAVLSNSNVLSMRRISDAKAPSVRQAAAAVHRPTTEETENALSLNRSRRIEIQRRLQLLGFDPKGVDGVFGQNTRDAISSWQADKGFPATGILGAVQLLALNAQSQVLYADYIEKHPPKLRKHRVKVCRNSGFFDIKQCRYEDRWY